jgi:hypothetical protein
MHSLSNKVFSPDRGAIKSSKTLTKNNTEIASIGSGVALQEPAPKTYAAQLGMTPPARDYLSASYCAYSPGQYTDF